MTLLTVRHISLGVLGGVPPNKSRPFNRRHTCWDCAASGAGLGLVREGGFRIDLSFLEKSSATAERRLPSVQIPYLILSVRIDLSSPALVVGAKGWID